MEGCGAYTGTHIDQPDEKGRLALPSHLRNSVPGEAKGKQLYVTWHPEAPCLIGSGAAFIGNIEAFIVDLKDNAAAEGRPFNAMAVRRKLNAGAPVPLDPSGRFIMPDTVTQIEELGDLEGEIFFLGMGAFFEIWSYPHLMSLKGEEYEVAQALAIAKKRANEKAAAKKAAKP